MSRINWRLIRRIVPAREVRTFLLFCLLAFVIWLMYTIGTQREIQLTAPVVYYGVPDDVHLQHPLPTMVKFTVADGGSHIWQYFFASTDTIEIDLAQQFAEDKRHTIRIGFTEHVSSIMNAMSQTYKIVSIEPSLYESHYDKVDTRRVPLRLSNQPNVNPEYTLLGPVLISPSTVCIRGPRDLIGRVQSVRVDTIRGEFSQSATIHTRIVGIRGVEVLCQEADVTVNVERMTEKSFTLPILVRNQPEGISVRLFPKKADVIFNVGLSRYRSLTSGDINLVFDCDDFRDGKPTVHLKLESKVPLDGIDYKIEPSEVEFIKDAL